MGLSLYLDVDLALSIPGGQRDCDLESAFNTTNAYKIVTDTRVTVNNGDVSRNCIITFSTEVFTSLGDLTLLGYTIDSTNPANCQVIGPQYFHYGASSLFIFETATHMGVKNIGSGTHTIRPCFLAADNNGGGANSQFGYRCLTVECRTQ
jgi:hypothetical protein